MTMRYNTVGYSGLQVSAVGIGGNNFGRAHTRTESPEGTLEVVRTALESGINLFDLADCYGREPGLSETLFGKALNQLGTLGENAVVVTKFGMDMRGVNGPEHGARGSRRYMMRALDASLKRLGRDHVDLYLYHTPDGITPPEETLAAMSDAVRAGKVRYIGTSNHAGWQLADLAHLADEPGMVAPIATESHYNLLDRRAELEVIPAAQRFGLGTLPYFPLANGLLTGKYRNGKAPDGTRVAHSKPQLLESTDWQQIDAFIEFAHERELSPLQVALSWLATRPTVPSVIAGATTPEQVRQNAQAADWVPQPEDEAALEQIFPAPDRIALF